MKPPIAFERCRLFLPSSLLLLMLVSESCAFHIPFSCPTTAKSTGKLGRHCSRNNQIQLYSIIDDITNANKDRKDGDDEFEDFNPLSYKANKIGKKNAAYNYSGTQISLRKTRMQQLNNDLLNVAGDKEQTQQVLEDNKDFLLEPLEESDAVLDPDSVYAPGMSRDERYQAYRESMEQRLESVRNPQVKWILQAMKDFVLSFE